ncbi:MAG TPA: fatty acid--CoA ligase family protein [Thermoanaerobaculia bacterium]|nr:fatty acid--CoA ligase family protein [Thermoanaerobaculia bacterium]
MQAPSPSTKGGHESPRQRFGARRREPSDPLLRAFELLVRARPQAPLVVAAQRRATVADVDALARAASRALGDDQAPPPGAVVGLAAGNGPGFLASLIALRRAGLAALLLDAHAPEAESLRIARALGAAALLRCRMGWPDSAADWARTSIAAGKTGRASEALHLPGIAVVKLTSGSTGTPRGIATPAAALLADDAALTASMGLRPDDRLLTTIPLSHSYGLSSLAVPALARGVPLVVPEESGLFGPFTAAEAMAATVFPTVPAYLDALLRISQAPAWPPSLRLVIAAGAPLGPQTAGGFRARFGLPVHVFYGASECGGICYDREGGAGERGSVGTPVEGVRVSLLPAAPAGNTAEGGDWRAVECASGTVFVEGPAVADGYVPEGDPRLVRGHFVAGDRAAWNQGELVLLGRQDALINIKGKKIDPREVEAVIGQLAGVEEVAVMGVPVPERQCVVLRAVIACRPSRLSAGQVLAWCRGNLAAHKVPRSLILVPEMPRDARGKLDRSSLLALRAPSDGRG